MPSSSSKPILGVDIGGTKVAAGLFTPAGAILAASREPMVADRVANDGLKAVFRAIDDILAASKARGARSIGISVPGWVDFHGGKVIKAANLPCWRNYPLARKIAQHYGLPAQIANDADAAALAEATWGAGARATNVFYVSLGTGIGTGMASHGRVCLGRGGSAFEGGHMTINFEGPQCPCGKRGCIEMYASGKTIARMARARLRGERPRNSRMLALAGGAADAITAEIVTRAAKAREKAAQAVLRDAADSLAIWLGNIIDLLEPDVIILGGGLGHTFIELLPRIRQQLKHWAINPRQAQVPIIEARFGAESALVGAAALCVATK
jgi:glucokinase